MAAALCALALWAGLHGLYALYPFPYRGAVLAAARADGVDPRLLLAVMRTESRFQPRAVSRAGAIGLMQLTPETAAWVAERRRLPGPFRPTDLYRPSYNIAAGSWYLAHLQAAFAGRAAAAVAAYNAGGTPVATWLGSGLWDGSLGTADVIPYPETRLFVARVLGAYAVYRLLYPGADPGARPGPAPGPGRVSRAGG